MRYWIIFLMLFLSSCAAGIDAPPDVSPDNGPDFDAKINTNGSSYAISSGKYKMQVRFPIVFPETEIKGKKFTVEVK